MWNAQAIAILMVCVIAGCAPTKYDGVYMDEQGFNVLISCTPETTPNGREVLFCSRDDRGVW